MGREMLGNTTENAFRVPIIKETSVNERPSVSEVTRKPDAYEGMAALGEMLHRTAKPTIERVFKGLQRERMRGIVDLGHRDPERINMALIEDVDAGVEEGLEGVAELEGHAQILQERVDGRAAIIAELEAAGADE